MLSAPTTRYTMSGIARPCILRCRKRPTRYWLMPDTRVIDRRSDVEGTTKLPLYLSPEYRNKMGKNLKLTGDQEEFIKKRLKKELETWEDDVSELHQALQDDYDLAEGNAPEDWTLGDWVMQVDTQMTGSYIDIYHAMQKRSIHGTERIWIAEADAEANVGEEVRNMMGDIEETLNYYATRKWNIAEQMTMVYYATNRDGLAAMEVEYVEEFEPASDTILIENPHQFAEEFPDPESAGMSPEEYMRWAKKVLKNASPDEPFEVKVEFDKLKYRGCRAETIEYVDFVMLPATSREIDEARGYGKHFPVRKGYVRQKMEEGLWYKKACKKFLSKSKASDADVSSYVANRDMVE